VSENPTVSVPAQIFRGVRIAFGLIAGLLLLLFGLAMLFGPMLKNPKRGRPPVVVYAAQDQVYAEPILRAFEQETGIKVKTVFDSEAVKTVGLANRLLAERNHPQCDVFWGNEEMHTRQLAVQGVFRETNAWAAFGYRSRRIVINTNFVAAGILPAVEGDILPPGPASEISVASKPPSPIPPGWKPGSTAGRMPAATSLLELTNETWRGKVALAFPQFGTTATHFHALRQLWGQDRWLAWCRALAANQPFIVDGNSVVVKFVARGEAWIGLTDSDDIAAGQREGLPIAMLDGRARHSVRADALPDGDGAHGVTRPTTDLVAETLLIPNTVAVIRNAPHPANAQKLFEYLQGREVAEKLVVANALESEAAKTDGTTMKPDWEVLLRELDTTTKQLNEIFLR